MGPTQAVACRALLEYMGSKNDNSTAWYPIALLYDHIHLSLPWPTQTALQKGSLLSEALRVFDLWFFLAFSRQHTNQKVSVNQMSSSKTYSLNIE